ncbi:MAG TPA: hypothetical protein VJA21_02080 [Verrucomicrobiae bacterium]
MDQIGQAEGKQFPPDYGLTLLNRGVHQDFRCYFYTLYLDHISSIGTDLFTTVLNLMLEGKMYSLSLDFSGAILKDMLEKADPETAVLVRRWTDNLHGYAMIELPRKLTVGVRLALGEKQNAEKETYVPFVVEQVL